MDVNLVCHRCGAELVAGRGDFFVVKIEAMADPTPPVITAADLAADTGAAMEKLLRQMEDMSERELMDTVYRRMTLYLCGPCYRAWIERPV